MTESGRRPRQQGRAKMSEPGRERRPHTTARSDTEVQRPHPLEKSDYETLAQFRYLLRRFAAFSEEAARRASLTVQQHQALLAVKGFPEREQVSIGELAERLNLRHHSTVGLVDRLVARGLIRRVGDPKDRRRVLIELTGRAQGVLARLSVAHRDELRSLAPLLTDLLRRLGEPSGHGR